MKWIFWIFNVVMALGLVALFLNLLKARTDTISPFKPPTAAVTPTPLKYPSQVIITPNNKQTYSGIVNNSVFYPERKPPTPSPTPTTPPPTGTGATPGTPTPAPKQCERLDNVRYVTHFVNWGTPVAHLEVINPQTGTSSLERLQLNDEFKNWKVCEITIHRVVLKGTMNNEEIYHMYSPDLSPMGQQLNKATYDKIIQTEAGAKTSGLPVITPSKPEIRSMTPPPPPVMITPAPVNTPVVTPPPTTPAMTPPPERTNPRPFGTRRDGRPPRNPFEKAERERR